MCYRLANCTSPPNLALQLIIHMLAIHVKQALNYELVNTSIPEIMIYMYPYAVYGYTQGRLIK